MARLTLEQRRMMVRILADAQRAAHFLAQPSIRIIRTKDACTTTLDFPLADGTPAVEICKEYGSELVGLYSAIQGLERVLGMKEA